ncbi:MAG: cobalt-factor II C(20)-methyltransferase [Clostridium sp.]
MGKLYGIGVGPGDPELLTIKAVKTLEKADIVVVPTAMAGGKSIAYDTAKEFIKGKTKVLFKHFPMGGEEQESKIYEAYKEVEELLSSGLNVAFLTIGDPFVYSTYIYLLNHLKNHGYDVETVPGITSFCACASIAGEHLVIGDEALLITPATRLDTINDEKFVVIMKVYKVEEEVIKFLEERGYTYTYIKKAGREGQEVLRDKEDILKNREYMSLIIARKN